MVIGPALAPPAHDTEVVHLRVDGMGCEACQANVQRMMDGFPGVLASEVDFKSGSAKVLVARRWGEGRGGFNVTDVVEKLFDKGYMVYPIVSNDAGVHASGHSDYGQNIVVEDGDGAVHDADKGHVDL